MKTLQIALLTRILNETKKPSNFRAFFIGLIFPEFQNILGNLSEISALIENYTPKDPENITRFVRVRTSGAPAIDPVSDSLALQFLQDQYGEKTGLSFFVGLASGKSKCASIKGPYMLEYRGAVIAA